MKSSVKILGRTVKLANITKVSEVHYGFIRTNKAHIHIYLDSKGKTEKLKFNSSTSEVRSARMRLLDKREKFLLEQQIRKIQNTKKGGC